jgi:hypothetical protein
MCCEFCPKSTKKLKLLLMPISLAPSGNFSSFEEANPPKKLNISPLNNEEAKESCIRVGFSPFVGFSSFGIPKRLRIYLLRLLTMLMKMLMSPKIALRESVPTFCSGVKTARPPARQPDSRHQEGNQWLQEPPVIADNKGFTGI